MRRQGGGSEGVTRRTSSNSAEAPKIGAARYERPFRDSEESVDLTNFRPISLTVSTFFKQVNEIIFFFSLRTLEFCSLLRT